MKNEENSWFENLTPAYQQAPAAVDEPAQPDPKQLEWYSKLEPEYWKGQGESRQFASGPLEGIKNQLLGGFYDSARDLYGNLPAIARNAAPGISRALGDNPLVGLIPGSTTFAPNENVRNYLDEARTEMSRRSQMFPGSEAAQKKYSLPWFAENLSRMAFPLGAQMTAGAAGPGGYVSASFVQAAGGQYEQALQRNKQRGYTEEEAAKRASREAIAVGAVSAAIDRFGYNFTIGKLKGKGALGVLEDAVGKGPIRRFAGAMGAEAGTEGAQELTALGFESLSDFENYITAENFRERVLPAAVLGGVAGAAMRAPVEVAGGVRGTAVVEPRDGYNYSLTPEDATRLVRENPEAAQAVAQSSRAGVNDFARWGVERGQGNRKEATAQRKKFQEEVKRELDVVAQEARQQQEAPSVAQPAGPKTTVPSPNQTDVPTADTQTQQISGTLEANTQETQQIIGGSNGQDVRGQEIQGLGESYAGSDELDIGGIRFHGSAERFTEPDPSRKANFRRQSVGIGFYMGDEKTAKHYSEVALHNRVARVAKGKNWKEKHANAKRIIEADHDALAKRLVQRHGADNPNVKIAIQVLEDLKSGKLGAHVMEFDFQPKKVFRMGRLRSGRLLLKSERTAIVDAVNEIAGKRLNASDLPKKAGLFHTELSRQVGSQEIVNDALRKLGYDAILFKHPPVIGMGQFDIPHPNEFDVLAALNPEDVKQFKSQLESGEPQVKRPGMAAERALARRIARALPGDANTNVNQVLQQLRQDPEGLKQKLEGQPGAESLIQKIEGYQERQVAQQERQPDEIGFPTAGFGAAINLRVGKRTVTQEIMHHFKGMMTSLGHSPELIRKLADTKSMNLNNEIFLAKQNERRYRQALKQEFGKSFSKLDKPVQDTLENLIHDKQLPQMQWSPQLGISEDLFITMKAMRNSIDTLSEKVIGTGRLNEDTEKIYEAGKGKYTIRQYRMYEDSKYRLRNVPEEILNNAIDWFQQNLPNNVPKTREHITNLIDAFLNTKGKTDIKVKGGGGDGVMDLTAMLKRDESIPVQLRDLMGEFKDPGTNYIKSVEKLANILETYRFQDDLAQLGRGVFLFSREDADLPAGMKIIGDIKDPRSAAKLGPLNGLYTTPEIAQIIEGQPIVKINNLALKLLAYGSTGAKLAKTVYSVQSVTRNLLSGFNFLLKNGSNPIVAAKALKEAIAFVSADIKTEFTQKALDEKWEAKVLEWQAFLGEEVNTNEIRELFERTRGERNFKFFDSDRALNLLENPAVEKLNAARKRFHNLAMKFYLHGDTVWKIAQYEVEKIRLKKYRTDLSDAEIQAEAAEITKNVMPTYSRVFQWVKSLRRSPFLASFPSFAAEMIRNDKNIFRQSMKEIAYAANATGAATDLKSGNIPAFMVKVASHPAGRIGLSRAGGLAMASVAGPALLAALFKMENEVSDEEDKAIRELDPFWSRNGWWLYWGKDENGFNRRVDLSYMHTDQSIIKPLIALAVNNDPTDALREAQEPFLGLDLHFDALIEALSGFDDEKGRELYQSSDTGFEKGVKGAAHYSEVLIPGTATTVKQILDSLNGKVRRDGKIITPTEAFMSIAGVKRFSNDPTVQVGFSANAFKRSMSDAKGEFYSKAKSRGDESEDALVSAFISMETSRERAFNTMKKKFDAAVTLSNTRDVLNALSQKLTKEEQQRLMANAFEEWRPSDRFWEGVPPRKREVVASAIQKARAELQDRKALQESGMPRMPQ